MPNDFNIFAQSQGTQFDQIITKKKTVEIKSLKNSVTSLASTATSADNSECNSSLLEEKSIFSDAHSMEKPQQKVKLDLMQCMKD